MKTLFLTLVAAIFSTTLSFAQENSTASAQTKTELAASKESGKYLLVLPAGISAEQVNKSSKYYTHYFTVEFNESSREAKITMVSNDEMGRHVIVRFLASCGVQNVIVEGKTYLNEDFFLNYLK
jgi:type II secretory pathway component PulK